MKLLRRIPVLIVVLAVLALSTAWAAHRHKQELASDGGAEHCELCLQVGRGAAPASVAPALVVVATGWALWLAAPVTRRRDLQALVRSQQARAPPR